jgi:large conductance mechanosensitive channel
MLKEFREFISRGNVLDLAVAVVIGVAFGAVVTALVDNIIMPIIGIIIGGVDFKGLTITVGSAVIGYGAFIQALIDFLIIAFVIFMIVRYYNRLLNRFQKPAAVDPTTKDCPYCLTSIPLKATRCPACTSQLGATAA